MHGLFGDELSPRPVEALLHCKRVGVKRKRLEITGHRVNEVHLFLQAMAGFRERARRLGRSFVSTRKRLPRSRRVRMPAFEMKRRRNKRFCFDSLGRLGPRRDKTPGVGFRLVVELRLERDAPCAKKKPCCARVLRKRIDDPDELLACARVVAQPLSEDVGDANACVERVVGSGVALHHLLIPADGLVDPPLTEVQVGDLGGTNERPSPEVGVALVSKLCEDAVKLSERVDVTPFKRKVASALKHLRWIACPACVSADAQRDDDGERNEREHRTHHRAQARFGGRLGCRHAARVQSRECELLLR